MASVTFTASTAFHNAVCCCEVWGRDFVTGQTHQAITANKNAIAPAVATAIWALRGRCRGAEDTVVFGSSATASGFKEKTRTDRAIFLTLCSPLSSKGYGSLSLIWS